MSDASMSINEQMGWTADTICKCGARNIDHGVAIRECGIECEGTGCRGFEPRDIKPAHPLRGGNTGHGHVWERPDGMKARCGGPKLCSQCALDYARSNDVDGKMGTPGDEHSVMPKPINCIDCKAIIDRHHGGPMPSFDNGSCGAFLSGAYTFHELFHILTHIMPHGTTVTMTDRGVNESS